jgi:hypothetical protein
MSNILVGNDVLIGCGDKVGCVVGAEQLATSAGVWVKVRFYKQGPYLCATVYSVAQGEPRIFEMKVDLRPIQRAVMRAHSALHGKDIAQAAIRAKVSGDHLIGWSLGKMWKGVKETAKKIGRNKLVKGIASVTKAVGKTAVKVAKSKAFGAVLVAASVFPLTAPFAAPALAAYAAANTAIAGVEQGKKLVQTAQRAGTIIKQGANAVASAVKSTKAAGAAVKAASARMSPAERSRAALTAKAAGKVQLSAKGKVAVARAITAMPQAAKAAAANKVKQKLAQASKVKTQLALAKRLPPGASAKVVSATRAQVKAKPLADLAARTAAKFRDPNVQKQLLAIKQKAEKSKAALEGVQQRAKTGDLDAQKSAAIVNLVARNRARIQAMTQTAAAGLPGLLITPRGKIVRGRFRVEAKASASAGLLYQGPGKNARGSYATVSGPIGADIMIGCGCL